MSSPAAIPKRESSREAIVACPDLAFRRRIVGHLRSADWSADVVNGGADTVAKLEEKTYQLLLIDRRLPDLDSAELVEMLTKDYPLVDIILIDRDSERFLSRDGRAGSEGHVLEDLLEDSRESKTPLRNKVSAPPPPPRVGQPDPEPLDGMIGTSAVTATISRMVRLVAPRRTPVLVVGETGTGKELVARALHEVSPRARNPFVVVNCAAIPEALLEAELFGYERGAFTGAVQSRAGRIRVARGGTLFLDEIGEIPLNMQAKLLRFLQEGEIQRLGSPEIAHVETRVVAATNQDLNEQVRQGKFRADLYYRLSVFPIHVPPLRERPEDILPIAEYFTSMLCRQGGVAVKRVLPSTVRYLEEHAWPGNVRELQHAIERAFILSGDSEELLLGPEYGTPLDAVDRTGFSSDSPLSLQHAV